jgi:hypothetical protein
MQGEERRRRGGGDQRELAQLSAAENKLLSADQATRKAKAAEAAAVLTLKGVELSLKNNQAALTRAERRRSVSGRKCSRRRRRATAPPWPPRRCP